MRENLPVTEQDIAVSSDTNILSTTDLQGRITYINENFIDISGFTKEELVGQHHNIIRHPFMPEAAFADLWNHLKAGRPWMGIVKNRSKNGNHYWVDAYANAILDKNGEPLEFQSVRVKASEEVIERAEKIYSQLNEGKTSGKLKDRKIGVLTLWSLALTLPLVAMFFGLYYVAELPLDYAWVLGVAIIVNYALSSYLYLPLKRVFKDVNDQYQDPVARYIYTGRNDDIGQVSLILKQLATESGSIVGRMSDDGYQMMSELEGIKQNTHENVNLSQALFTENEQVASAVDQMISSIQEVGSNIRSTAELADESKSIAADSQAVIQKTVNSINVLATEIKSSAAVINQLEEVSNNINNMVNVIQEVAEQINLLALNAAIEAARAGEQGRGFAVVADEVRTLATRTHKSTEEITDMVDQLKTASLNAVSSMAKATDIAGETVEMTTLTTESIDTIVHTMEDISNRSAQIAAATEEQSVASDQVNQNVAVVKEMSEDILDKSKASEAAVNKVFTTSNDMYELAQQFWRRKRV